MGEDGSMMYLVIACLLAVSLPGLYLVLKRKNMTIWLPDYIRHRISKPIIAGPRHIMFCFVDHYEPQWGKGVTLEQEHARVDRWCTEYPRLASRHLDADGVHPQHTFFYPEEEYRKEHLDKLSNLCNQGYGEIEVHLHHDNDTSANLTHTLTDFVKVLHEEHGALPVCKKTGEVKYGFIHGNWCLDNSRSDGRWCGVNDELLVLKRTGCYADFTLPSAPSDTQTSKVNSIYYATDNPDAPKSHDTGTDVRVGGGPKGDLMIIQGPLLLNWKDRKYGLLPRIEAGDIRSAMPPTEDRVDLWVDANVHVKGRPEWIFVKVHTHGTQEQDMDTLLGEPMDRMFAYLESRYNDGVQYLLHYVTAREVYNIVKAAEAAMEGDPGDYRNFILESHSKKWTNHRNPTPIHAP